MKIPSFVKIKNKVRYEVVWIDSFKNPKDLAECRYEQHQIAIKLGQSKRETVKSFIHEVLHAAEIERGIKVSHRAIYQLEEAIYYLIFHNDWEKSDE